MQENNSRTDNAANPIEQTKDAIASSPTVQKVQESAVVQKGVNPLRDFFTKFSNDWTMKLQAGALAYSLLVAMFPIIVALLAIVGLIFGGFSKTVQTDFISTINGVLPQQGHTKVDIAGPIFQRLASISGPLGIIALILAIFAGSRLFVVMENCFSLIYHQRSRTFLKQNVMAICMVLIFAILIPIMIVASSLPAILFSFLNTSFMKDVPGGSILIGAVAFLGSALVAWLLFEAIYLVVPNQKISFRHSWRGAAIAAIALQIYLFLFPLYATHFLGGYLGQVGFAVILIVFFYYFAAIVLVGAQVNAFFGEGVQKTPENLADLMFTRTHREVRPMQ